MEDNGNFGHATQSSAGKLMPVTGLVLAGGAGRRMGGADKAWLAFEGRPLIRHALYRLEGIVSEILISANRHLDRYAALGYPVLPDPEDGFPGPLTGLLEGLRRARQPWLLALPVDCPRLPVDIASRLWAARENADVVVGADSNGLQPLICLCRTGCADRLADYLASGGRRAQDWFRDLPWRALPLTDAECLNCNRPEDLR